MNLLFDDGWRQFDESVGEHVHPALFEREDSRASVVGDDERVEAEKGEGSTEVVAAGVTDKRSGVSVKLGQQLQLVGTQPDNDVGVRLSAHVKGTHRILLFRTNDGRDDRAFLVGVTDPVDDGFAFAPPAKKALRLCDDGGRDNETWDLGSVHEAIFPW